MKKLYQEERGVAMVLVLALMVLAIPIVTASLSLASTLSIDSRVKTASLRSGYCDLGAQEFTDWVLSTPNALDDFDINGDGSLFVADLPICDEDGSATTVTIIPEVPVNDQPELATLETTKAVDFPNSDTIQPNGNGNIGYTIIVENKGTEPQELKKIFDGLPDKFEFAGYIGGSNITNDPPVTTELDNDGDGDLPPYDTMLTWDLTSQNIILQPGEFVELNFKLKVKDGESLSEGMVCNEAWTLPEGPLSRTGQTAPIKVGSPAVEVCSSDEIDVEADPPDVEDNPGDPGEILATYTIYITNTSGSLMELVRFRNMLPTGFEYVPGSIGGTLTANPPDEIVTSNGRQRLDWFFTSNPIPIPDQTSKTVTFKATRTRETGSYWNQTWAFFQRGDSSLSFTNDWPSSVIVVKNRYIMDVDGQVIGEYWEINNDTSFKPK